MACYRVVQGVAKQFADEGSGLCCVGDCSGDNFVCGVIARDVVSVGLELECMFGNRVRQL